MSTPCTTTCATSPRARRPTDSYSLTMRSGQLIVALPRSFAQRPSLLKKATEAADTRRLLA
jgi:hypothetical protein